MEEALHHMREQLVSLKVKNGLLMEEVQVSSKVAVPCMQMEAALHYMREQLVSLKVKNGRLMEETQMSSTVAASCRQADVEVTTNGVLLRSMKAWTLLTKASRVRVGGT